MRDIKALPYRHFLYTASLWMGIFILTNALVAAHPFEDIVNDPSMSHEGKASQIRLLTSDEISKNEDLKRCYQSLSKELPNLPIHFVELLKAISDVYSAQKAVWILRLQIAEMRICAQSAKATRPVRIRRNQIIIRKSKLRPFQLDLDHAEDSSFHDDVRKIIKIISKHYHDNDPKHFVDIAKIFLPLLRQEKELSRFYKQEEERRKAERALTSAHSPQPTPTLL